MFYTPYKSVDSLTLFLNSKYIAPHIIVNRRVSEFLFYINSHFNYRILTQ